MCSFRWFVLGFALIAAPSAWAQQAPRPAVQVVIGPDGSLRVIDVNTGREIPSSVKKLDAQSRDNRPEDAQRQQSDQQLKQARQQLEMFQIEMKALGEAVNPQRLDQLEQVRLQLEHAVRELEKKVDAQSRDKRADAAQRQQADQQLEQARQHLEKQLRELEKKAKAEAKRPDGKPIELELHLRDTNIEKAHKPGMEQKIDMLLRQMDELRRDVNQLKNKLEGKGPPMGQFVPRPGEAKDNNPEVRRIEFKVKPSGPGQMDDETVKQIHDLIKKLEAKRAMGDGQRTPPANRTAELEQRLERVLREVDELRREILKNRSPR